MARKCPEIVAIVPLSSQSIARTAQGLVRCCSRIGDPSVPSSRTWTLNLQRSSRRRIKIVNELISPPQKNNKLPFKSPFAILRIVLYVKLTGMRSKRLNVRIKSSLEPDANRPSGAYWLISRASKNASLGGGATVCWLPSWSPSAACSAESIIPKGTVGGGKLGDVSEFRLLSLSCSHSSSVRGWRKVAALQLILLSFGRRQRNPIEKCNTIAATHRRIGEFKMEDEALHLRSTPQSEAVL